MSMSKIFKVPKDLKEIQDTIMSEIPGVVVILWDRNYESVVGSNETAYSWLIQKLGKWSKSVVNGAVGILTMGAEDKRIAKAGKYLLATAIAEAIHKGIIAPEYARVEKVDGGLKVTLEGFGGNESVIIFINGTQVATGTTDANGALEVTITGTVDVKASVLTIVTKSKTFTAKIPYSITPTTT